MAVFALYIEKQLPYFGGMEVFGNTYHYSTQAGEPFPDADLALFVAQQEQAITSSRVDFVGWRTWGPTDGAIIDNIIREAGEFSFPGLGPANAGAYNESCSLPTWPLPRSPVLNRQRWLRKFLRLGFGASTLSAGALEGSAPLPPANQAEIIAYADAVRSPPVLGIEDSLCTALGVEPNGPSTVRPYLFTRQIGT